MQHEAFMQRAIQLAHRGSGRVAPNPLVGAVLVHEGRIIGEGWHHTYGDVHAEVACLQSVAEADKPLIPQSTMYVTLEPCAHQGKQPPCAHRLVQEGIPCVVIAARDPFPQVSGKGIAVLKAAGVHVETGVCEPEARWLCRRFLAAEELHRPYIILKWAASADGFFAPADGSRLQLSNHFSQVLVHRWRAEESAILVGYRTALADNPQLNVRAWQGPQPLRLVLDMHLSLPQTHHLLDGSAPTWIINEEKSRTEGPTSFLKVAFDEMLLPSLLQRLLEAGKTSLFVEGGAALMQRFIDEGLWDEARVFITPKSLGNGLRAPLLKRAHCISKVPVSDDELYLFQPAGTNVPFVSGAWF
jgi:diaminohydroxyphosphoribosylaminopyrimidine deaminase/5-amino-6-(5-phosphoribosylamino)uracil reductase